MTPPANTSDIPGILVSFSAIRPPEQDSAAAKVILRSISSFATTWCISRFSVEYTLSPSLSVIAEITGFKINSGLSSILHSAVTLIVTSPSFAYGAMVGFV